MSGQASCFQTGFFCPAWGSSQHFAAELKVSVTGFHVLRWLRGFMYLVKSYGALCGYSKTTTTTSEKQPIVRMFL